MPAPENHNAITSPSDWITRFKDHIAPTDTVLDLACGGGRHGRIFLTVGCAVTFVDKNIEGLADLPTGPLTEIIESDLEGDVPWPLADRTFDGVIVTNYLWRPILPSITASVAPSGILLYETFAEGNEAFGRPRNPNFILRTGELLDVVRGQLDVIAYEQRTLQEPSPRVVQRLAARRPL